MRCPEVCDVNGKQVQCMYKTLDDNRPRHFAHRWTSLLKNGRMEIHWRTSPKDAPTLLTQRKRGVVRGVALAAAKGRQEVT